MIPTAVPSAIAMDNHRTAFAMNSSKSAIMVAVADADVDILCERGDCNQRLLEEVCVRLVRVASQKTLPKR
jgi:hypothetical protein